MGSTLTFRCSTRITRTFAPFATGTSLIGVPVLPADQDLSLREDIGHRPPLFARHPLLAALRSCRSCALTAIAMTATKKSDVIVTAGMRTLQETRREGSGVWKSISDPMTSETIPPTVRIPWLITLISAMNRMMAKRIRAIPGVVHGEGLHRKEGHDQGDPPDHAGENDARIGKFEVETGQTDQQEDIGDVRIAERGEDLLPRAHVLFIENGALRLQDLLPRGQRDLPAVHLCEQLVQIRRDEIDHLQAEGLFGGDRFALPDRLLDPLFVPRPLVGDPPDIGHGVVFHLPAHRLVHAAADPQADGMGRADVRPRRHRRDVGGHGDDDPGRGRPRPGGCDIDDDGQRGVQDPLGDVPHRQIQAARRIETDDQPFRTALRGLIDALDDVFGNGRGDGGADRDHIEDRRLLAPPAGCCPAAG